MEEQEKKTLLDVIHQMQALANQYTPDEIAKILDLKIFSERFDESSVCHTFTLFGKSGRR